MVFHDYPVGFEVGRAYSWARALTWAARFESPAWMGSPCGAPPPVFDTVPSPWWTAPCAACIRLDGYGACDAHEHGGSGSDMARSNHKTL